MIKDINLFLKIYDIQVNLTKLTMTNLMIEETEKTPKVDFNSDGNISLTGRSLPGDATDFYTPVITWIKEVSLPYINLTICLDYINTGSSKYLFIILQLLKNNQLVKTLNINWHYEIDDECGYDMGLEYESLIQIPFNFYSYTGELNYFEVSDNVVLNPNNPG